MLQYNKIIMKKIIIVIVILILIVIGYFILRKSDNYDGIYEIYVEKIDDLSPDRHLIIKKDGKETKNYKSIKYSNDGKEAILCYASNPVTNKYNLDIDELIIILPNDKEIKAKVIKE